MSEEKVESESLLIGNQLRTAREALALSIEEVAQRLGIEAEQLQAWEEEQLEPPVEILLDLAELYRRSIDYFLTPTPPPPEDITFRLPGRHAILDLPLEARQVVREFEELCRAATEMERLVEGVPGPELPRQLMEDDPDQLAVRERERLGLGDRPIKKLRTFLEEQGIRIFELPVPENVFSGLSWWHDEYGPCILINASDTAPRRAFTVAHEYAHLLAHDKPFVCDLNVEVQRDERFANRFARSFLMPASDVRRTFQRRELSGTALTDKQLGSLASRYGVSLEAMARRLEELRLVPRGTTDSFIAAWEARGKPRPWGRGRAPKWRRRVGDTFSRTAFRAYWEGQISIGKLAEYLGLDARKAVEVVEKERGKGSEAAEV